MSVTGPSRGAPAAPSGDRRIPLRCGVIFSGDEHAPWLDYVRMAGQCGFQGLGIGDSPAVYPDTYMRATIAASLAPTLRIGPMVTNPLLRHPVSTACSASTLESLAPGRSFVAIGSGNSAADNAGVRPATVAYLEAYSRALKQLLATGEADWEGAKVRFALKSPNVPVHVAGSGPRMLQMAGRTGDGAVVGSGVGDGVDFALSHVARGAAESGRRLEDLEVSFLVYGSLAPTDEEAFTAIANSMVTKVRSTYKTEATIQSLPAHLQNDAREVTRQYNALHHADFSYEPHTKLAHRYPELMHYVAERNIIMGSPATVVRRLREIAASGVRNLWIVPRIADKPLYLRLWSEHVAPHLVAATQ
jgi:5,10-methylenetetrahydromethanopterin reductase